MVVVSEEWYNSKVPMIKPKVQCVSHKGERSGSVSLAQAYIYRAGWRHVGKDWKKLRAAVFCAVRANGGSMMSAIYPHLRSVIISLVKESVVVASV